MARKNYTEEFRQKAVDLYESTPGATLKAIAVDLGITRGALREWVDRLGSGTTTDSAVPAPGFGARPPSQASRIARLEAELAAAKAEQVKLETERDILRQAAKYFASGDELVSRFQFVEDHRDAYGVKRLCQVLEVTRSSFYAWVAAAPSREARAKADEALAERIRQAQDPTRGGDRAYGAPRVTAELNDGADAAGRVNHKRVARVMRQNDLAGIRLKRRVKTTIPEQAGRKFPDLIGRDFSTGAPGRRYVGDITYLPIKDGSKLYLATCIDLGSRKLAGWAMADHMRVELVKDALAAAWRERGSLAGAVFHSDHGSVYTSSGYAQQCEDLGVLQSMGKVGTSADNALAESFNAALKRELLQGAHAFENEAAAYRAVFHWANRYNTRRRHSAIGNISPNAYENATLATLKNAA
ncbi:IS3 family transposase [Galactobacter valiniphilus]|uniref:IS3 family transposase n=1 Tax=Galactobacter valiniphilus TaxID=2676122 RepID=A0A399J625_9MICC|nr:IS3 family transposase [Galactobacter valiniphilus]RII40861.1 IS3 family transposase [Galactobacter valiniphilus]